MQTASARRTVRRRQSALQSDRHLRSPKIAFQFRVSNSLPCHLRQPQMHSMAMSTSLRVHAFLPCSRTNGPGTRAVIWAQGCSLGCPGCFNPQTQAFSGGEGVAVEELFQRIVRLDSAIESLTLSGGEPFQQREAVAALLAGIRRATNLSVIVFTGYTWEEGQAMPQAGALLAGVDVLTRAGMWRTSRWRAACAARRTRRCIFSLTDTPSRTWRRRRKPRSCCVRMGNGS